MACAQNKPIGNCYWRLNAGYFPYKPVLQNAVLPVRDGFLTSALDFLVFSHQFT